MNAFAEALPVIWVALGVVLLLILNMRSVSYTHLTLPTKA